MPYLLDPKWCKVTLSKIMQNAHCSVWYLTDAKQILVPFGARV